jgi:hypothetical protein
VKADKIDLMNNPQSNLPTTTFEGTVGLEEDDEDLPF